MTNILIIDKSGISRSGLFLLIQKEFLNVKVHTAELPEEIQEHIRNTIFFDLIILSDNLADATAELIVKQALKLHACRQILIFSEVFDYQQALLYFVAGATGYMTKNAEENEIVTAINSQLNGTFYISPAIMSAMTAEKLESILPKKLISLALTAKKKVLSKREFEIVEHLISGKSNSEIGHFFNLKQSTVSTHKANIFKKLNVFNTMDLRDLLREESNTK